METTYNTERTNFMGQDQDPNKIFTGRLLVGVYDLSKMYVPIAIKIRYGSCDFVITFSARSWFLTNHRGLGLYRVPNEIRF